MMDVDLNLWLFFDRAKRFYATSEIVTLNPDQSVHRISYAQWASRTNQLMHALDALNLPAGAVVGTLGWNSSRHLEAYFAVPCSGRVLHTLNIRQADDDLVYIINHAGDAMLLVDADFVPIVERIRDRIPSVSHVVVWDSADGAALPAGFTSYEQLISGQPDAYPRRPIDERTVMGLCYTSGTTGRPKGVPYTHRSTVLEAMAVNSAAGMCVGPNDCVLPVVPMFHAAAWGMPYAATAVGAKQVYYAGSVVPERLVDLLADEHVTISAGVPTVWMPVAQLLAARGQRLPDMRHVISGGSQPPIALIRTFTESLGIPMVQAWGMTESSPMAAVAWPRASMRDWSPEELATRVWNQAGVPAPGVEISVRGEDGTEIAADGQAMGDLYIRGPWVTDRYLADESPDSFQDGWFRTGDVVISNPYGYFVVADRTKDLIKSGGEWISSVDMESAIMAMPAVNEAAVIAMPDPKWGERPLPCVALAAGESISLEQVREHLQQAGFARWQLPGRLEVVDSVPKTAVGKFDKKLLRVRFTEPNQAEPQAATEVAPERVSS